MRNSLRILSLLMLALWARTASAQVVDPELFGDGKPPVYREEDPDRRFMKTGIYGALNQLPKDPACRRIVATLLVAYADALPYLHRKDQNVYVDQTLLGTLNRTISTRDFPAQAFLMSMIRRTMIDKKVPAAWIASAEELRAQLNAPIEVARMKLDENSVGLIDSFSYTMPALLDRYARDVKLATSVAVPEAEDRFRDKYMDRDITWGGLLLWDVAKQKPPEPPKKSKHKHKNESASEASRPPSAPVEEQPTWAVVGFPVGIGRAETPGIPGSGQAAPQIQIRARLKDDQLTDLSHLVRGARVLVKGHLWDIGQDMDYVEVRDAYIFPDVDWSSWPGTASFADVDECPIAVNDLSPYGYVPKQHNTGPSNPYQHSKGE